ncbi:protein of unknown function [Hyphomicrobium sp. 1Nfss2.1]|uniref:hypothetical protein n=1 Tax=Hyphomicrobium sp. 1Nfss2.1 TaxID=3413936 RepID=UPI003C7C7B87
MSPDRKEILRVESAPFGEFTLMVAASLCVLAAWFWPAVALGLLGSLALVFLALRAMGYGVRVSLEEKEEDQDWPPSL